MGISWAVRCYIRYNVKEGDMFTTRELLRYGNRNAIDQILYRLVKAGIIIRLAWGVFVRQDDYQDSRIPLPGPMEVARVKARAFCREVYMLAGEIEEAIATIIECSQDGRNNNDDISNGDGIRKDDSVTKESGIGDTSGCKNDNDCTVNNSLITKTVEYKSGIEEWQKKSNDQLREIADYARYGKARKMHGLLAENAEPPEEIKAAFDRDQIPSVDFATDGHSSSFYYGAIKIVLKSVAPRKRSLRDTAAGVLIRLAWSLGEAWVKHNSLWGRIKGEKTRQSLIMILRQNIEILPSWMTEALFWDLAPGSEYQGMWQHPARSQRPT